MKKWTSNEISFIIENYNLNGTEYCVTQLNRSKSSIFGMATKLGLKAKKPNAYSKHEIQFLIDNYCSKGIEYCQKHLFRTKQGICAKAHELNLHIKRDVKLKNISEKRKYNNFEKYDVNNIVYIKNKYSAYILGFLWADGHIRNNKSKLVSINLVKDDANFLYKILSSISTGWKIGNEIKKFWKDSNNNIRQAQNQRTIRSYSQELYEFLEKNDYKNKSFVGFNKIWNLLSEDNKKYFMLGLFDGDGHFNYQKRLNKYHSGEFVITSSYKYDWTVLEDYFMKNKIEYSIYRLNFKIGQVSKIVVRKKKSLIKLYKLLYSDKFVGLERKYLKFLKYYETVV